MALVRKELVSINQEVKHTRETLSIQINAKFAQAQVSNARWNIGMFVGTVTMFIGLAGLIIALD